MPPSTPFIRLKCQEQLQPGEPMKSLLIVLLALSTSAFAKGNVELTDCENAGANLTTMNFGAENQKSFYKGQVGVLSYWTEEPAASPTGIAIVYNEPLDTEAGYISRKCVAITYLASESLKTAKSSYDPKTGVTLTVNVGRFDGESVQKKVISINIKTINTGKPNEGHVIKATEL